MSIEALKKVTVVGHLGNKNDAAETGLPTPDSADS
jgi:hypothetical protein